MKTTRLRKIECETCGVILRGSRGPLTAAGLPTCGCGARMRWADLEDAYACLDGHELYEHPGVADEHAREERRLARESSARSAGGFKQNSVGQCGGCCKPITATNEHCKRCGFRNDLRRHRNDGGYSDGMPF